MGFVVRVLGPLQVVVDGVDVTPAAPKERALLALLALSARQIVSADRIIEELWPTLDARRARHALHVRVAELRKVLRQRRRRIAPQLRLWGLPPRPVPRGAR